MHESQVAIGIAGLLAAFAMTEIWPVGFELRLLLAVLCGLVTLFLQRRRLINFVRH